MKRMIASKELAAQLHERFGDMVKENVLLAPYTSARIGGAADIFITAGSVAELERVVLYLWESKTPFVTLGGGANILVSDQGVRGVVLFNRAKEVEFHLGDQPFVAAESGVVFSNLANRCASKGLSGLEWGSAVPGTIGGAVYGNAGAFGGDIAGSLISAELLTESGREKFSAEQMGYVYRSSVLKRGEVKAVVLSAELKLENSTKEDVTARIHQFVAHRKATQPPGASMGSMFKNPSGDYAGRLIEVSGLKGARIGNAEISQLHGNFFINHGETRAEDIRALIELARKTVQEKQGVKLELEIEFVGDWQAESD